MCNRGEYTWGNERSLESFKAWKCYPFCHLERKTFEGKCHEQISHWTFNASQARCQGIVPCLLILPLIRAGNKRPLFIYSNNEEIPSCTEPVTLAALPGCYLLRGSAVQLNRASSPWQAIIQWPHIYPTDFYEKRKRLSRRKQTNERMRRSNIYSRAWEAWTPTANRTRW